MRARLASRQRRSTAFRSLANGSTNFLSAVGEQLVGDLLERDAGLLEVVQGRPSRPSRSSSRLGRGRPWSRKASRVVRRNRVDGVGPDQLLDVEHVAVARVLGARAGPEHALRLRALRAPGPPSAARRRSSCSAGRRASRWRWRPCPGGRSRRALSAPVAVFRRLREQGVDGGVDAAHEEAGHAGDLGHGRRPLAARASRPSM